MKDYFKTKDQLIEELTELRRELSELKRLNPERERAKEKLKATEERFQSIFDKSTAVIYTERKQAEEALKETEERFQSILDNSTAVIYAKDLEGRYLLINHWFEKVFHVDRADIKGKTDHEIFPKELADAIHANDLKVLEVNTPVEFEEIAPHEDGPHTYISMKFPLYDALGAPYAVCGISTDITERKEAEEALKASEERFRTLSKATFEGIVFSKNGICTDANKQFADIFGYELDEVIGMKAVDMTHPEDRELVMGNIQSGSEEPYEYRALCKDGSVKHVEVHGQMTTVKGEPTRVTAIKDITERQKAEGELRAQTERLRSLFDNSPAQIFMKDMDGRYLFINRHCENIFSVVNEDIVGKSDHDIFSKEMADAFRINDLKVIEANKPLEFEEVILQEDGLHTVSSVKFPLHDAYGKVVEVCGFGIDITERKRAEVALRVSEERFRSLSNATFEGICFVKDRIVTDCNRQMSDITGYGLDEMIGMDLKKIIHPDDMEFVLNKISSEYAEPYEHRFLCKDSSIKFIEVHMHMKMLEDDRVMVVAVRDITERRHTEDKLRQSREELRNLALSLQSVQEEERGRIARDIHDDLGQIMTALDLDLSFLVKKLTGKENALIAKTMEMSALIKEGIVTIQRISSELRPALLDDLGLVAAIEWQSEEYQERTGITCEVENNAGEESLDKDISTALFRAFQEALTNIARHSDASKADVSLTDSGDALVLQVKDNGKGITEDEATSKNSVGLTGMRERFYSLGGSVEITGIKGMGTTVRVSVPMKGAG